MGGAIARGLLQGSLLNAKDITVIDLLDAPLKSLSEFNSDIQLDLNNYDSVKDADIIILAVKPWLIKEVIFDIKFMLNYSKQIIVSIAAGISIDEINSAFSNRNAENTFPPVFRVIPNTAIAVKQSITLVASSKNADSKQEELILNIFNELGSAIVLEEDKIPAGTALTSCGIAFFFRYARAAMLAGTELGISPQDSQNMIVKTMLGAACLMDENKLNPEIEIDKVTTPGGITIKGINELEANGFSNAIIKALKACKS